MSLSRPPLDSATLRDAGAESGPEARPVLPPLEMAQRAITLLSGVIDRLPIGVSLQDQDGKFLLANNLARRLLALPNDGAPNGDDTQTRVDPSESPIIVEECAFGPSGEGDLLRLQRSVRLNGEVVRLSALLDISERKIIERQLAQRADFDELTGLPNRSFIERHVERLIHGSDARFAIAFLDVDDFKQINDYYGHAIGDALLVQLAKRLIRAINASDFVARISGDEFLLLLCDDDDGARIAKVINDIIDSAKQPFIVDAFEICVSASIGVSFYPAHGLDYRTLRHNADSAMYQIKRMKKGGAALFDPKIEQLASERIQVEQRLRLAIRDRRFRCAFQPKVDIYSGDVVGVEALIRLLDENGDVQQPSSFIKLAIELGLIDDLTHLAVAQITDSIDRINDAFGSDATISVNIAAKQASDVDFMRSVTKTLASAADPSRFIVEVTEEAFVARSQFQTLVLPMLREIGARVSIDDFGTGYSSLSALADITADEIKIDRSFITNIHERKRSQSILKAIESLASALSMTVIAEGVETLEELAYLRTMTRIRFAQGFYYAKPIFLDESAPLSRSEPRPRAASRSREHSEGRVARARLR
jgi:diguanylate cyclase (GGDEF)-like protein